MENNISGTEWTWLRSRPSNGDRRDRHRAGPGRGRTQAIGLLARRRRQFERHVPVGGARARVFAVLGEEADVQHVLVGADLGHAGGAGVEAQAQHLRGLAAEHLLEHALRRRQRLRLARLAQDAQDDRRAVAQRIERRSPRGELAGALL